MKSPATRAAVLAVGLAAALALSACGSGSSDSANSGSGQAAAGQSSNQGGPGQNGAGQNGGRPGVTGKIAAKSGKTLQVQSSSTQTAVTYTGTTTITKTVSASASTVKVGDCVEAMPKRGSGGKSGGRNSSDGSSSIATVTISSANAKGECSVGAAGMGAPGGAQAPNGKPGKRPSGQPSNMPSGAPNGGPKGASFGGMAAGVVTSVKGNTITVKVRAVQPSGKSGDRKNSTKKTSKQKISVTSSTKYTKIVKASGSALSVGACMTAQGKSANNGRFKATSIRVSKDGTCSTGGESGSGADANGGSTND